PVVRAYRANRRPSLSSSGVDAGSQFLTQWIPQPAYRAVGDRDPVRGGDERLCARGGDLKALDAKATTLERGQTATQNLAHSLIEHAAHTIQAADISMTGIVEFLEYQTPLTERFNRYLAS